MVPAMGKIFGRWLLASVALGAVSGGLYGVLLASTLGSPDEAAIVSDAPVAIVLGIGLGMGSIIGLTGGAAIGSLVGVVLAVLNQRSDRIAVERYIRRTRIIALAIPVLAGVALLAAIGRLATYDLVPVVLAGAVWGAAAKKVALGYRAEWRVDESRLSR